MTKAKTWWDYHEEIEALKEKRGARWREIVGDAANDHASDDEVGVKRSIRLARQAEAHPDVLAIESEIRMLRAEQMELHSEPSAEESDAYHARMAAKE